MFENNRAKFVWIPLIPGAWYAFVTVTYIVNAKIGFNLPWAASYAIGIAAAAVYAGAILWYGKNVQPVKRRRNSSNLRIVF